MSRAWILIAAVIVAPFSTCLTRSGVRTRVDDALQGAPGPRIGQSPPEYAQ
jgi:hypothetical protein